VLFMPGANLRALEKARDLPADGLIFDLEDAVAPTAKDTARAAVAQALQAGGYGRRELVLRPRDAVGRSRSHRGGRATDRCGAIAKGRECRTGMPSGLAAR
jgi:citrate lyase subunit beta/citryl-CoA lyase